MNSHLVSERVVFHNMCQARKDVRNAENHIWEKWQSEWENDIIYVDGKRVVCHDDTPPEFKEWINATMKFVTKKQDWNRRKNFICKFLGILAFPILYGSILFVVWNNTGKMDEVYKWCELVIPLIALIPAYAIGKWIDARRFQETWSRHTAYRSALLQEMLKYIYEFTPYDNKFNKKKRFIEEIMFLTKSNGESFKHNMEEKEKDIVSAEDVDEKILKYFHQ